MTWRHLGIGRSKLTRNRASRHYSSHVHCGPPPRTAVDGLFGLRDDALDQSPISRRSRNRRARATASAVPAAKRSSSARMSSGPASLVFPCRRTNTVPARYFGNSLRSMKIRFPGRGGSTLTTSTDVCPLAWPGLDCWQEKETGMGEVVIGVDAHKRSHTLVAVDQVGRKPDERVATSPDQLWSSDWRGTRKDAAWLRCRTGGAPRMPARRPLIEKRGTGPRGGGCGEFTSARGHGRGLCRHGPGRLRIVGNL
jgi:hypothetical protein